MSDCCSKSTGCCAGSSSPRSLAHFDEMISHCLEYAREAKRAGQPIVGIMCEYTPRELIMAADAVPVCLCGGSAEMVPVAEAQLPANLCPLIKSTYGYHLSGKNPFIEMADLIVAETTCDGKKKMFELLAEKRPMHVLELPQKAGSEQAMTLWLEELRQLQDVLEEKFDVVITDDKLRKAIQAMNRERRLRRSLAEMMKKDTPPFTGRQLLKLKSSISAIEADLEQYERILDEVENGSVRADTSGRVRVLMTGVPVAHGAERVVDLIEEKGGLIVCMETCTGVKPVLEDVEEDADDPLRALATKYFNLPCSVMTRNDARLDQIRQLVQAYRPDCVIDLVWQACLTYDIESDRVRRMVEDEMGLPYLHIVTDYSPADSARIEVRVEALFEMVQDGARV